MCCRKWEVGGFLPISLEILVLLDPLEGKAWMSRHTSFWDLLSLPCKC